MGNKSRKEYRVQLYNKFSQNLKLLSISPGVNIDIDCTDKYLCPLCVKLFDRNDLTVDDSKNYLTFEDIPPKELGGKVRTLTCKKCNNEGGHLLDAHLVKKLREMDFVALKPNSNSPIKIEVSGGEVNALLNINNEGVWVFDVKSKNSNPVSSEKLNRHIAQNKNTREGVPLSFSVSSKSDERRAELALLRVAYLIAFTKFGSGLFLNDNLTLIRRQLSNPNEEIVPKLTRINYNFELEFYGVNFIKEPKELRCMLVIFDLVTESGKIQYAIPLPAPLAGGLNIYHNITNALTTNDFTNIEIENIGDEDDYLLNEGLVTFSLGFWKPYILNV